MRKITYNDLDRRYITRRFIENADIHHESAAEINADLYYDQYKTDRKSTQLDMLLKECANSVRSADKYFLNIIDMIEDGDTVYEKYMANSVVKCLPV